MRTLWMLPIAMTGVAVSTSAQTWTKLNPTTTPSARTSVVSVFNPFRQRTLLFGGRNTVLGLADTWTWNGTNWTQLTPKVSPPGRWAHNLCLDWHRKRVVTFGGRQGTTDTNDTWEWDGSTWIEIKPKTVPPARRAYGMAYDMKRRVTVMFGGAGFPNQLGDTWTWNGTDWKQLLTTQAPTPRDHPRMVYDESRGVIVLFGGWDQKNGNKLMDDTWEFDGTDWTRIKTKTSPPGRYWHNMVYDRHRARIIMNGGMTTDTWEYDGKDWKQIVTTSFPLSSSETATSFDWIRRRLVHFGGSNRGKLDTETWEYQGSDLASYAGWGQGCTGSSGSALLSSNGVPQLGKPIQIQFTNMPASTGALVLFFGASHEAWASIPLPLALKGLGMGGCALEITPDLVIPMAASGTTGSLTIPIPNVATLLGSQFYNQGMIPDAPANKAGWILSNAARGVIGK